MNVSKDKGVTLYRFESPAFGSVTAFVTSREPNSSSDDKRGNFDLGLYCGDNKEEVECNLNKLCNALSIARDRFFCPHQVHGHEVCVIDDTFLPLSQEEQVKALDGVDAIVTSVRGIAIAVATADCVPIILYDTEHQAIAAIHAGWRGTAQGIVRHTIDVMRQTIGTYPTDVHAGIAPCIGIDAYEVGDEVIDAMRSVVSDINTISIRNKSTGEYHIDLAAANVEQLLSCGVELEHIEVCGICTYSNSDTFYSVRALGIDTGRFITGIMLPAT